MDLISQSLLFLVLLLSIALIAKNKSLIIAVSVLILLKVIGVETKLLRKFNLKELIGA
jgi:uncharacterized membrane protein (DUF441 family)